MTHFGIFLLLIVVADFSVSYVFNSPAKWRASQSGFRLLDSTDNVIDIRDSIRGEISDIINMYLQKCSENVPLSSVNPTVLIENSYLLSKVGFYEEIMEEHLNACSTLEEVLRIEKVDVFLRKFISSERKSRSRLKINYLMAGAATNRFEEAVQTLSDCDEIDNELLLYTNNLMQREYQRALGPAAPLPASFPDPTSPQGASEDEDSENEIDGELLGTTGAQVINVLRMIYNRLLVETKMKQNKNVRVLARAMNTNNAEIREQILRVSFQKVEEISDFEEFLVDAIQHVTNLETAEGNFDSASPSDASATDRSTGTKTFGDRLSVAVSEGKGKSKSRVPKVGTLENLREVQYAFLKCKTSLVTGLSDDNLFSTTAEDYKQWSSTPEEPHSATATDDQSEGAVVNDLNNLLYGPDSV